MSAACCAAKSTNSAPDPKHRRILWIVLAINLIGFLVEIAAGLAAGSASLQADALDFLADAGNYTISLLVFGMALRWRAWAAFAKGTSMGVFGLWVVGSAAWYAWRGEVPAAEVMGGIGVMALLLNAGCLLLLTGFRSGDANMRSVWVCSRNDAIGNLAVMAAALGVFDTGTGWPDIIVAAIMAALALWGAGQVIEQAVAELRQNHATVSGYESPSTSGPRHV